MVSETNYKKKGDERFKAHKLVNCLKQTTISLGLCDFAYLMQKYPIKELIKSFHEAVNDYIEICKLNEKPIHKSFKGNFNVRIPAELHKKAVQKSILSGQSLNQFVKEAIEHELLR